MKEQENIFKSVEIQGKGTGVVAAIDIKVQFQVQVQVQVEGGGVKGSTIPSFEKRGSQEYLLTHPFWEDKLKSLLHIMYIYPSRFYLSCLLQHN